MLAWLSLLGTHMVTSNPHLIRLADFTSRTADIAEKSVGGEDPGIESWLADGGIYRFQSVAVPESVG